MDQPLVIVGVSKKPSSRIQAMTLIILNNKRIELSSILIIKLASKIEKQFTISL
jgi:hypothetical protein